MQLYDYIFWTNLSKNDVNKLTTKIAMISNHLQPIVLAVLIMYFGKIPIKPLSSFIVLLYSIVMTIYSISIWNKLDYTLVEPKTAPSLNWKWNEYTGSVLVYGIFMTSITVLLIQHFPFPVNYVFALLGILTYIFSWHYYKGKTTIGRFWCFFASFLPLLVVPYYVWIKK
jgi:hypothetical protein